MSMGSVRSPGRPPNMNDEIARRATNFYSKLLLTTSNYICPVLIAAQSSCLLCIARNEMLCSRHTHTPPKRQNGKGLPNVYTYTAASIHLFTEMHTHKIQMKFGASKENRKKGIA